MTKHKIQVAFFFILFFAVFALLVVLFLPYVSVLALAAVLAFVFYPLYERVVQLFRGHEGLAALCTLLLIAICILLPFLFVGFQIFQEAVSLYEDLSANKATYLQAFERLLSEYAARGLPKISFDIDAAIRSVVAWLASHLGGFVSQTLEVVFKGFLGCIALYYFLKCGKSFVHSIVAFSPLADRYDQEILNHLAVSINSVMKGSLFIALIQGCLTGIGFAIFGVPNSALWGSVAMISALIPGIGTALVLIPGIIFLFATGETLPGIGLSIWGMLAVGLIDNMLGPRLIGRGTNLHPLFILFSVIGGLAFFGPLGFLFGPLILSLWSALITIYKAFILEKNGKKDRDFVFFAQCK